ncbi:aspartate kinase [filamentous cyanobacterium LEGE 11480]|uniref:aspartate kinase n=1 Tax=Romeriopsis navalis LEGE 11480 TaxID=2777977 RepID=A0A928VT37_9CYAN|nr:aspartate kinase [Romeriopsis navalis]MBE9032050.1 aspartate kinase [Romeriopsis navalis LEGE 11480]
MALIVQKYGGTSVGSVERIQAVAQRIKRTVDVGNSVVVVVSAMGKTTDGLVKLASDISANPSRREMDMLLATGEQVTIALLSMALQEIEQPAISLTGAQVGILTEAQHSRARILNINPDRIQRHLDEDKVIVVAGFQGVSPNADWDITTLGRGGSDTSAVALAAALRADFCEIYTDVPGILTTDPRLVPEAQLMAEVTSDEMLELASLGAKVLHPRAVEIARNYGMPLVVRSSWSEEPGTWVRSPQTAARSLEGLEIARPVDGVEFDTDQAKIAMLRVPDQPGVAAKLFKEISQHSLDVDLIIQSIHEGHNNDIAFTVATSSLSQAESVANAILPTLTQGQAAVAIEDAADVTVEQQIAKVSIAGAGMIGRPGVAAEMFTALSAAGINIRMISTSEVKVSCVIDAADCDQAIATLCTTFDIETSTMDDAMAQSTQAAVVRGVALDLKQARLAVRHVPDVPGMAAQVFQLLAEHNISVDMIIQSQRCRVVDDVRTRDIAFTVAQMDADAAKQVIESARSTLNCGEIVVDAAIAKVSVVGSGMVGQPGVAGKMFEALYQQAINIQMIATSEIKVSCVVHEDAGVKALKAVHDAFELAGEGKVVVSA